LNDQLGTRSAVVYVTDVHGSRSAKLTGQPKRPAMDHR